MLHVRNSNFKIQCKTLPDKPHDLSVSTRTKARWEERTGSTVFPCDLHICFVAHVCVSSSTQHTGWKTKAYLIAEDFVSQKSWFFNNPPGYFLVPSVSFWKHERTCPSSTIHSQNNGQYRNIPRHPVELYITIKGCAGTPPSYRLTSSVADLYNRCSCYA